MNDPRRQRDMRDMVVNSAWKQLMVELEKMVASEKDRLCDIVREKGMEAIKHQGGLIDGIDKVRGHLQKTEDWARNASRS